MYLYSQVSRYYLRLKQQQHPLTSVDQFEHFLFAQPTLPVKWMLLTGGQIHTNSSLKINSVLALSYVLKLDYLV